MVRQAPADEKRHLSPGRRQSRGSGHDEAAAGAPSPGGRFSRTAARARQAKGESVSAIAKALGISRATLYRHLGEGA
ncbi:helix-turn-helix domain-containing protein [Streptomyces collinus]|uniref:helix-turn-helix domain-containing protein n=1 Tax=Streptomyces collinus TaxID=42684 RepID=UPI0036ED0B48